MAINCYDVLKETLLPQPYGPGPTSPLKTAIVRRLIKWPFKEEVRNFFSQQHIKDKLVNTYSMRQYPRTIVKRGEKIQNNADVECILRECVFKPVNFVCQTVLGLDVMFGIAESTFCLAASQVDCSMWKLVRNENKDLIQSQLLVPIDVKDIFHFYVDGEHLVNMYNSPPKWEKVVRYVKQILMYMIEEGSLLGVLASDREHIFFLRSPNPQDKNLYVSETILFHEDDPTVREAYTYLSYLAVTQYATKLPIKDVKISLHEKTWLSTFLGRRKSQILSEVKRSSLAFESHTRSSILKGNLSFSDRPKTAPKVSRYAKFDHIGKSKPIENEDKSETKVWFKSLTEFSFTFLHLGEVISKTKTTIVREGSIFKTQVVVKLYNFSDHDGTLEKFYKEVKAYETLFDLQGECLPLMIAYGSLFGGMQGFLALSKEGSNLNAFSSSTSPISHSHLRYLIRRIHGYGICHNNLSLYNIVSRYRNYAPNYRFIDFANCKFEASTNELLREEEAVVRRGFDKHSMEA